MAGRWKPRRLARWRKSLEPNVGPNKIVNTDIVPRCMPEEGTQKQRQDVEGMMTRFAKKDSEISAAANCNWDCQERIVHSPRLCVGKMLRCGTRAKNVKKMETSEGAYKMEKLRKQ